MLLKYISYPTLLLLSAIVLFIITVGSISTGPMDISFSNSLYSLFSWSTTTQNPVDLVIHQVRLPRTLLSLLVGAILAISGVVMQGLFRNPLAEPGIIGVSAGAAFGAALAIVILSPLFSNHPILLNVTGVPLFAFLGGAITTLIVYRLGTNQFGTSITVMLLAGVAISALAGAGISYLSFSTNDQMLRDLSLWSMGSLASAEWTDLLFAFIGLLVLLFLFMRDASGLNALLLGEAEAKHLGVSVQALKKRMIILCAVGVGICVSLSGMIGFIGLVIPHIGRMLVGPNHKTLLPLSAILGGLLLTGADIFARVAVTPAELPVGIVTALIGAPFFLYLLFTQRGKMS